jgi:hypothetical protein
MRHDRSSTPELTGEQMAIPIASDYPFMNILWSTLIFVAFVMWFWLVIMIFTDLFRRHDMGGFAKAMWIIFIILIPFLGALIYVIAYQKGIAERTAKQTADAQAQFDAHVKEVAGGGGAAHEIEKAKGLLDSGAITQAEFDQIKARALAGA